MNRPIRILLADDHAILRDGIRALLNDEADLRVVGEADNGRQALDKALPAAVEKIAADAKLLSR